MKLASPAIEAPLYSSNNLQKGSYALIDAQHLQVITFLKGLEDKFLGKSGNFNCAGKRKKSLCLDTYTNKRA